MKKVIVWAHLAVAAAGLGFSGATLAQSTWNWGETPGCDPSTCTVGGITATVYGYGAEASNATFLKGSVRDVDPSGLGVTSKDGSGSTENTSSPNHAIDNFKASRDGYSSDSSTGGAAYAEVLAIQFSQAVSLTEVAVAWTYTDSDAMIFRWDGGSLTPTDPLSGVNPGQLPSTVGATSSGWTLVSAGQFSTSGNKLSFTDSLYSSYWLVSTALGQTNTTSDPKNTNNDGFKVSQFKANLCAYTVVDGECNPPGGGGGSVPEPASLALAAFALVGLGITRRRARR